MNDWLTIREFAAKAQVSKQAVYQRIKSLEQYTRQDVNENGKSITRINSEALALFEKSGSSQVESQVQRREVKLIDVLTEEIDRLKAENEAQKAEIQAKDKQIYDLATRFADLAAQAQQLTAQAQTLHAADKPRLIAAQGTDGQSGDSSPVPPEEDEGTQAAEVKKHGKLWKWLFGG